jgi:exonuclease III
MKIISWNISWGSMKGDPDPGVGMHPRDTTAAFLAYNLCYPKRDTQDSCLNNVLTFLLKGDYDIIALQEVANRDKIIKGLGSSYNHSSHIDTNAEVITFYKKKYKHLHHYGGTIHDKGRPYLVLFLENEHIKKNIIIINLHNGHHITKPQLETNLSSAINSVPPTTLTKKFDIIVCGDFNDHGKYEYWRKSDGTGLKPFKNLDDDKNNILKHSIVSVSKTPPNTCCVGATSGREHQGQDNKYGDYILVNNKLLLRLSLPDIKDFNYKASEYPTSDHLPIIGHIQFRYNPTFPGLTTIKAVDSLTSETKDFILVFKKNDPTIIGYIQYKYIVWISKYEGKCTEDVALRLEPLFIHPNDNIRIKGPDLKKNDIVVILSKEYFKDKIFVVYRDCNDVNYFTYMLKEKFNELYNEVFEKKYYKYKNKYLNMTK